MSPIVSRAKLKLTSWAARNARMPDQRVAFVHGEREVEVGYQRVRDGRFRFSNGEHGRIHQWSRRRPVEGTQDDLGRLVGTPPDVREGPPVGTDGHPMHAAKPSARTADIFS